MQSLLKDINSPEDLKKLEISDLDRLSTELREFIIEVLSQKQGHLASSLGVVELTVALHYVFNTPYDRIVWDVGHQAYAHKILTGRKENFATIRSFGGLSGFPTSTESEFDSFGTGHSSTSISAILGMATASKLSGEEDRQHIAVIGDGALTGGMAFEALNNAGFSSANILIILNDNGISIDKSSGALSNYLTSLLSSPSYNRLKTRLWNASGTKSRNFFKALLSGLKALFLKKSIFFDALSIRYFGPVDGHDTENLVRIFRDLKKIKGPKLLHIVSTKGKGLKAAEVSPTVFHAPPKFDCQTGELIKNGANFSLAPKYQDVFGKTILELAQKNKKIIGVTPAMPSGCSLNIMMKKMPERCFDVGIAEPHALCFSAGMAKSGMIPFCNIYSSFMQRAYDQIIHDVALQKLPVVMCIDRAGLVGEDGATHHGAFDLAYLRPIPNLIISAPRNEIYLRNLMYTAQLGKYGSFAIRYPRGRGVCRHGWKKEFEQLEIGRGERLREGSRLAFVCIGHVTNFVIEAVKEYLSGGAGSAGSAGVSLGSAKHETSCETNWNDASKGPAIYDMIFLKPIDKELLREVFREYEYIITVEDGVVDGGLGSAVCEEAINCSYKGKIERLGIPSDRFILHGTPEDLYKDCGFDKASILNFIKKIL